MKNFDFNKLFVSFEKASRVSVKVLESFMNPDLQQFRFSFKIPDFSHMTINLPKWTLGLNGEEIQEQFRRSEARLKELETLFEIKNSLIEKLNSGAWHEVLVYVKDELKVNIGYLTNRIRKRVKNVYLNRDVIEQEICMFLRDYSENLEQSSFRDMSRAIGDNPAKIYLKHLIMNCVEERLKRHLIMDNPHAIVPDNLISSVGLSFALQRDDELCTKLLLYLSQIRSIADTPEDILLTQEARKELREALEAWRESLSRRSSKHKDTHLDLLNRFLCGEIENNKEAITFYGQSIWELFVERAKYFFEKYDLSYC
ncbi:MAG: hypothetical protein AB7F43_14640 [Bacteriovoracia bacterium]